jgi:hypothetical protein
MTCFKRGGNAQDPSALHEAAYPKTSVILRAATETITDVLTRHGFTLAAPVAARFREASHGSTGVEVTVRLEDSSFAHAARGLLHDRYGSGVDVIDVA